MKSFAFTFILSFMEFVLFLAPPVSSDNEVDVPTLPKEAVEYKRDGYTQSIFRLNDRRTIRWVKVTDLANTDWHQSGGMKDITHTSKKFRTLPADTEMKHSLQFIAVLNSFGHYQNEVGISRTYPDGTRFDDVLYYKNRIFEHRVREKIKGEWKSKIVLSDPKLRPPGYEGLKQSCSSCHDLPGSGGYAEGLVPGGDGVFSDPLDWTLVK